MELGEIRKLCRSTFLLFLLVLLFLGDCEGLNILIQHPYGTGSHVKTLSHVTGRHARCPRRIHELGFECRANFRRRGPQ